MAKYYSYNEHQMVPDMLIANLKFLQDLPPEERQVFDEAAEVCNRAERESWSDAVEEAKDIAKGMDVTAFREKVLPLHKEILNENPKLRPIYDAIQKEAGSND